MAADLATTPTTGFTVQACGDAHLANFGIYGTPERNLVFDLNDFDETLPGPWEWDLKRLAASVAVAGRANNLPDNACADAAYSAVRSYHESIATLAQARYIDAWYQRVDAVAVLDILYGGSRKQVRRRLARAGRRDNLHALDRMTKVMDGRLRIVDDPPLVTHVGDSFIDRRAPTLLRRYRRSLPEYRRALLDRYTVVDVARKVVGVGSVGTRCYIILLVGAGHDDPLFLQIKEAVPSVLQRYLGRSAYTNQGKRVVRGQQVIQAASDIFLGWGRVSSTFYYLRQLRDMKGSIRIDAMGGAELRAYAGFCGTALARTHARSGDPARISGYLGTDDAFDRALTAFASAYADQTERDHAALVAAVRSGRVAAVTGI